MKYAYPVLMTPMEEGGYLVYVPDFNINTSGADLPDAMDMARDAISLTGITKQDMGQPVPPPNTAAVEAGPEDTVTLVDVDFDAYRRARDTRAVRKNVTIPSYLNDLAERAGVNFSQVLQEALKQRLGVQQP